MESNGMANEVHSHRVKTILLVQSCHWHLPQVIALVSLGIVLIILLDKPNNTQQILEVRSPSKE